jgi:Mg2+-importing ATPase
MRDIVRLLRRANPLLARSPRILARAVAAQLAIVILDTTTLWVSLLAVGETAGIAAVFVSYMISSLFRTLSFVPGGLGAFEGASVYLLHAEGISVSGALAATLIFRGLSFWLPMLPGVLFARRLASAHSEPG